MRKLKTFIEEKFNSDARLDCKQYVHECARKATDQTNRRLEWEAAVGNVEVASVGLALEGDIMKMFKKQLRREGCLGKCNSFGGLLLGKGNPDKCALKDIDILN